MAKKRCPMCGWRMSRNAKRCRKLGCGYAESGVDLPQEVADRMRREIDDKIAEGGEFGDE
jgi:hypothetical protein